MCGRFGLDLNIYELLKRYSFLKKEYEKDVNISKVFYPSEEVIVIINSMLYKFPWGIKNFENSNLIINSRIENIINKKYFYEDFKLRRCIVPVSYFFEWDKINVGNNKYKIYDKNNRIMSLAGIYRNIKDEDKTYKFISLLTKKSYGDMEKIHHRMPIILSKGYESEYLNGENVNNIINNIIEYKPEIEMVLQTNNQLSFL